MPRVPMTLAALHEMDGGKIARLFEQCLRQCTQDCQDRPADKKPRTLTLQIHVVPVEDDMCDEVTLSVAAKVAVPKKQTRGYSVGVGEKGKTVVNLASDDNIHQMTIDDNE